MVTRLVVEVDSEQVQKSHFDLDRLAASAKAAGFELTVLASDSAKANQALASESSTLSQLVPQLNNAAVLRATLTTATQEYTRAEIELMKVQQDGANFQRQLNESFGIGTPAKSARDSAAAFKEEAAGAAEASDKIRGYTRDQIDLMRAQQQGLNFQRALNESFGIGAKAAVSARESAQVFRDVGLMAAEAEAQVNGYTRAEIELMKVQQQGRNFQATLNESFGIGLQAKSARDSAMAFKELMTAEELAAATNTQLTASAERSSAAMVVQARSANAARFAMINSAAQFQDILVMAQMGQAPATTALQQGTQLAMSLEGAGGLAGIFTQLGGAIAGIFSPVTLLTIGLVGLTTAGLEFFINLAKGEKDAVDGLKEHKKWLDEVTAGYKDAGAAASDALEKSTRLPQGAVISQVSTDTAAKRAELDETLRAIQNFKADAARQELELYRTASSPMTEEFGQADQLEKLKQKAVEAGPALDGVRSELQRLIDSHPDDAVAMVAEKFAALIDKARDLQGEINANNAALLTFVQSTKEFGEAFSNLSEIGARPISDFQKALTEYNKALTAAGGDKILRDTAEAAYEDALARLRQADAYEKLTAQQDRYTDSLEKISSTAIPQMTELQKLEAAYHEAMSAASNRDERDDVQVAYDLAKARLEQADATEKAIESEKQFQSVLAGFRTQIVDSMFERYMAGIQGVSKEFIDAAEKAGLVDRAVTLLQSGLEHGWNFGAITQMIEEFFQLKSAVDATSDSVKNFQTYQVPSSGGGTATVDVYRGTTGSQSSSQSGSSGGAGGGVGVWTYQNGQWVHSSFSGGGEVRGPGTSTSDSIPALLSDGEFVVNSKSTNEWKDLLRAINSGDIRRLASGGEVTRSGAMMSADAPGHPTLPAEETHNASNIKQVMALLAQGIPLEQIIGPQIKSSSRNGTLTTNTFDFGTPATSSSNNSSKQGSTGDPGLDAFDQQYGDYYNDWLQAAYWHTGPGFNYYQYAVESWRLSHGTYFHPDLTAPGSVQQAMAYAWAWNRGLSDSNLLSTSTGPASFGINAGFGFADGGAILPGPDSQAISFRKSPDEAVAIFTPDQRRAVGEAMSGGGLTVYQNITVRADVRDGRLTSRSRAEMRDVSARGIHQALDARGMPS